MGPIGLHTVRLTVKKPLVTSRWLSVKLFSIISSIFWSYRRLRDGYVAATDGGKRWTGCNLLFLLKFFLGGRNHYDGSHNVSGLLKKTGDNTIMWSLASTTSEKYHSTHFRQSLDKSDNLESNRIGCVDIPIPDQYPSISAIEPSTLPVRGHRSLSSGEPPQQGVRQWRPQATRTSQRCWNGLPVLDMARRHGRLIGCDQIEEVRFGRTEGQKPCLQPGHQWISLRLFIYQKILYQSTYYRNLMRLFRFIFIYWSSSTFPVDDDQ